VPVGGDMLPTGGEANVDGTDFDFRTLRKIGGCFDHSFVL
jgi:aldose 1-epimerase